MKRDAPITARVIVPALERLAGTSQQQRARSHDVEPERAPMLKRPGDHGRDRHRFVHFLEAFVARSRRADDVGDPPSIAARESPRPCFGRRAERLSTRQSSLEIERNFSQDRARSGG
jgi:hypothetical protein